MALSQRSFFELVEISSLMFLVLFKDETRVSPVEEEML